MIMMSALSSSPCFAVLQLQDLLEDLPPEAFSTFEFGEFDIATAACHDKVASDLSFIARTTVLSIPVLLPPLKPFGITDGSSEQQNEIYSTLQNASRIEQHIDHWPVNEWKVATSASTVAATAAIRYYATWTDGKLCSSKSLTSFEQWEESFTSLSECCKEVYGWDYDTCCDSLDMGGCV